MEMLMSRGLSKRQEAIVKILAKRALSTRAIAVYLFRAGDLGGAPVQQRMRSAKHPEWPAQVQTFAVYRALTSLESRGLVTRSEGTVTISEEDVSGRNVSTSTVKRVLWRLK
jgi:hypothetical protein